MEDSKIKERIKNFIQEENLDDGTLDNDTLELLIKDIRLKKITNEKQLEDYLKNLKTSLSNEIIFD